MSVLVFVENWSGSFKKSSYEAVSYAAQVAKENGGNVTAIVLGNVDNAHDLGKYGANKVLVAGGFENFNPNAYAEAISGLAGDTSVVIISGTNKGKSIAPLLSIKMDAALITNVMALPSSLAPLTVRKITFSSKGLTDFKSNAAKTIISFIPNSVGVTEAEVTAEVENVTVDVASHENATITNIERTTGKIPLPEAEIVVSAGRGMKAAENWNIIEELAETLGAGTACSKPVSDIGWRPHSEHVGQTGIQINPNLYIAIGISGAIQHLAGVNGSKTIVVINTDKEAPFFKAADYGIVGDAFSVVPKLTEAIKAFKQNS